MNKTPTATLFLTEEKLPLEEIPQFLKQLLVVMFRILMDIQTAQPISEMAV